MRDIDPDLLKAFQLKVWKYKQGELVSLMVHLGSRLGLYTALAGLGSTTSAALATETCLDERWVREWLLGQAAAGLVTRAGDSFAIEPEAHEVLVNEDSLAYATGAFDAPLAPEAVESILESFQTGHGMTYDAMGEDMAEAIDSQGMPWLRDYLIDQVISQLDGVTDKLGSGARVADVGCGGGVSTEALATRFPASVFVGVEPSGAAVRLAEQRFAAYDNACVVRALGEELSDGPYDLVLTLDCMHDVPYPDRIAAAIRSQIADDGVWLIKDMRASSDWQRATKNPTLALQYGYSISGCLASATSEPDGAALGTLGFTQEMAEEIVRGAGFSTFRIVPIKTDPVHAYYEARP